MWIIEKQFRFEASHVLPNHDGKCARLHGHSWVGRVVCQGDRLVEAGPETGMVLDFGRIKQALQPLVDQYLDHYHLNDTTELENPTSEELSRWIYWKLKGALGDALLAVEIEETCTSRCRYQPTE